MRRYIPSLVWLVGGSGATLLTALVLFTVGFLARDEETGSKLGRFAPFIAVAIYVIIPVGLLGAAFMAISRLRGVIDVPEEPNQTPDPTIRSVTPPADAGDRAPAGRGSS